MAFIIGGIVFLLSILYTVLTTKEHPPNDMDEFLQEKEKTKGLLHGLHEIFRNIETMPKTMLKLGMVKFKLVCFFLQCGVWPPLP